MNVVDSSGWVAYLEGDANASFFEPALNDSSTLIVPSICVNEVFRFVLRERGEDEALVVLGLMKNGMIVDLDCDLAVEAAKIGIQEGLHLADSVVYATAITFGATLWTQDAHFQGKASVKYKAHASRK